MSKYLISTTETYRVDTEAEVNMLIEEAKKSPKFELTKYNCTKKEKKVKGEVEDEWLRVVLTKTFTDEKEPCFQFDVIYLTEEQEFNIE